MLSLLALHDYDIVIIITIIYYVHPTFLITVQSLYHLEPIVRIKYKILHCNDLDMSWRKGVIAITTVYYNGDGVPDVKSGQSIICSVTDLLICH